MERLSHRDHVLLGYSPRKSFGSPKLPLRTSDVDFHDVFGGPPRRSSIHDWRHSLGDSNSSRGDEETSSYRSPWSGLTEKPVFGEEIRNRRRYQSDDFFDDIFRGDESSTSTPRKLSRDPFSSAPTSRIQSPAHPQPPQSEQSGGSSMPPLLSLPTKLAKEKDFPPFASPTRSPLRNKESASTGLVFPSSPRASLSRVLSQIIQGQDGSSNDARPFRQSRLSHELSLNEEGSPKTTKSNKQDSSSSEVNDNSSQFHFSIYKWACKGVPLVVPLRGGSFSSSKRREKTERPLTELPVPVLQGVEAASKSFWWEHEDQDISLILTPTKKDGIGSPKIIEELVPAIPGKPITNFQSIKTNVPVSNPSQNSGKENYSDSKTLGAEIDISLCEGREKEILISKHEAHKTDLKPLRCLFKDDSDSQENDKIVEQARMKEGSVKSKDTSVGDADDHKKVKRHVGKRITLNLANTTNSSLQDSPISSEDKLVSNRVKGKVKEFVKIFNQETPSQPTQPITNAETRGQRTGVKDIGACKTDYQESVCATKADGKEVTNTKNNRKLTDVPVMVHKVLKQSAKPHLGVNNAAHKIDNTCCERKDTSALHSESISKISEVEVDTIEDSHCVDLNSMVEELCHDQNNQPQPALHNEELQVSDVKIRQWSNGKEGNIRSLLSTMQYVLWPESGWKPVPLVDIIEGNSVKRAYQKALLCLHPDKLQQKGAAPHQKYIAEKVFDILQEAWTHFNSLGSF